MTRDARAGRDGLLPAVWWQPRNLSANLGSPPLGDLRLNYGFHVGCLGQRRVSLEGLYTPLRHTVRHNGSPQGQTMESDQVFGW